MKSVKITAVRKVHHDDLSARYENPIEHACDVEPRVLYATFQPDKIRCNGVEKMGCGLIGQKE